SRPPARPPEPGRKRTRTRRSPPARRPPGPRPSASRHPRRWSAPTAWHRSSGAGPKAENARGDRQRSLLSSPQESLLQVWESRNKKGSLARPFFVCLVGTIGLEPTTPTMSRWCSNQLSYVPVEAAHSTQMATLVKGPCCSTPPDRWLPP